MDLIERIADKALHAKARKSVRAIQRCIELFEIEHVSLSFNMLLADALLIGEVT